MLNNCVRTTTYNNALEFWLSSILQLSFVFPVWIIYYLVSEVCKVHLFLMPVCVLNVFFSSSANLISCNFSLSFLFVSGFYYAFEIDI